MVAYSGLHGSHKTWFTFCTTYLSDLCFAGGMAVGRVTMIHDDGVRPLTSVLDTARFRHCLVGILSEILHHIEPGSRHGWT